MAVPTTSRAPRRVPLACSRSDPDAAAYPTERVGECDRCRAPVWIDELMAADVERRGLAAVPVCMRCWKSEDTDVFMKSDSIESAGGRLGRGPA